MLVQCGDAALLSLQSATRGTEAKSAEYESKFTTAETKCQAQEHAPSEAAAKVVE